MKHNHKNQRPFFRYRPLVAALLTCLKISSALAGPQGGDVVAGQASIAQPDATQTVITQTSDKAIINWNQFNIDANEQTRFIQPSSDSITLNRVTGNDPSQILGRLSANGQIVLVNPNGVVFGPNSRVDVAALIATTHDIKNDDFMAGQLNFTIPGKPGAQVINQGTITVQEGGLVALVAPSLTNAGMIQARLGKVVLASANTFTIDFYGDDLILFAADSTITQQMQDVFGNPIKTALENSGTIVADSGYVLLTTDVAKNVVDNAINMSGIIKAQSAETQSGTIILNAGLGKTTVSGTLDASAPNGGNGGFIETSGSEVDIEPTAVIDTSSSAGQTGTWLLDPLDYYIAASGGDITGATLGGYLGLNNVIVQTATTGAGNGDIFVNDNVTWSNSNKLTLTAFRNINVNAAINGGNSSRLELRADNTGRSIGTVNFGSNGQINNVSTVELFYNPSNYASPNNYSGRVSGGGLTSYMLVNDVNQLQDINTNSSGNYALSKNIDATGVDFNPIGSFFGVIDGYGYTINNLSINKPSSNLIAFINSTSGSAIIRNLNFTNLSVIGNGGVGSVVSWHNGIIDNVSVSGAIVANREAGGIVYNVLSGAEIKKSSFSGNITGAKVGGITALMNGGTLSAVSASGNIFGNTGTTSAQLGGITAQIVAGDVIENSHSSMNIIANPSYLYSIGGIASGAWGGTITNSYFNGSISGYSAGQLVGGVLGSKDPTPVSTSNVYWDTTTSGVSTSLVGIGKTTTQMQQQSSYTGWDFTNTWRINEGVSYPTLAWQSASATPDTSIKITTNRVDINGVSALTNQQGQTVLQYNNANGSTLLSGIIAGQFRNDPNDLVWRALYQNGSATSSQIDANRLWNVYATYANADTLTLVTGIQSGAFTTTNSDPVWQALASNPNRQDALTLINGLNNPATSPLADQYRSADSGTIFLALVDRIFTNAPTDPVWFSLFVNNQPTQIQVAAVSLLNTYKLYYEKASVDNLVTAIQNNTLSSSTTEPLSLAISKHNPNWQAAIDQISQTAKEKNNSEAIDGTRINNPSPTPINSGSPDNGEPSDGNVTPFPISPSPENSNSDPSFVFLQNAFNKADQALEVIDVLKNPMKQLDLILEGMGDVFNSAASLLKRNSYDLSANLKEHLSYEFDLLLTESAPYRDLTDDINNAISHSDAVKNDIGNALENMALTTDAIRFALDSKDIYKNISSLTKAPEKISDAIQSLTLNYKTDITLVGLMTQDLMDLGRLVGSLSDSPTVAWYDTLEESIAKYDSITSKAELLNIVKLGKEMQQAGEDLSKVQAFLSDAISLIVTATYEAPLEHIMNDSVERTLFTQQLLFDSIKTGKPHLMTPDTFIYKKVEVDSLWSSLPFGSPKYKLEKVAARDVFDFTDDGRILWESMK